MWEYGTMSKKTQDASQASNQDAIEALRQASALCLDGYGQIGASYLAYLRNATELGMAAATAVLSAKSVPDAIGMQRDYAQQHYDNFIAESTKISAMSMKTANEVAIPLQKQFEENFAKFSRTPTA
jgi:hypothetical protein